MHLVLQLPLKRQEDKGSRALPSLALLCPGSSSYQGSFPGLRHSQRSHHSFTSGLAALDNCRFCLCPDLPKATQRGKLHPNSKSQYSSLTTRLSSLAFSQAHIASVSPCQIQHRVSQNKVSSPLPKFKGVHSPTVLKQGMSPGKSSVRRLRFTLKPNQSRHKFSPIFSGRVFHD